MNVQNASKRLFAPLFMAAWLLVGLFGLASCGIGPNASESLTASLGALPTQPGETAETIQIAMPPLIPNPPAPPPEEPPPPRVIITAYTDVVRPDEWLAEGLAMAIRTGLVNPDNDKGLFRPDEPISWRQFSQWYQRAIIASDPLLQEISRLLPQGDEYPDLMGDVVGLTDLEATLEELDPDARFDPIQPLSHQQAFVVFAWWTNQTYDAEQLSARQIELAMPPPGNNLNMAFSRVYDKQLIADWALPYVAQAYKSGAVHAILNVTPVDMVEIRGIQPEKPLTRAEAVRMLRWIVRMPAGEGAPRIQ